MESLFIVWEKQRIKLHNKEIIYTIHYIDMNKGIF